MINSSLLAVALENAVQRLYVNSGFSLSVRSSHLFVIRGQKPPKHECKANETDDTQGTKESSNSDWGERERALTPGSPP